MARRERVVVEFVDDIDGRPAHETVTFTVNGVKYEIDLSKGNTSRFYKMMDRYVKAARRVGGHGPDQRKPVGAPQAKPTHPHHWYKWRDDTELERAKAWLKSIGRPIPGRRWTKALITEWREYDEARMGSTLVHSTDSVNGSSPAVVNS